MQVKDIIYYKKAFVNLRRQSYGTEKAPHKVILLLAVFDRVEQLVAMGTAGRRMINRNLIDLNPKLERFFYRNWNRNVVSDKYHAVFHVPFFHMKNEPFWRLVRKNNGITEDGNVTDAVLKANYIGAEIDKNLMNLLLEPSTREELRDFLLNLLNNPNDNLLFETEKSTVSYLSTPLISFWEDFIQFEKKYNGQFADVTINNKSCISCTVDNVTVRLVALTSCSYVEYCHSGVDSNKLYAYLCENRKKIELALGILEWSFDVIKNEILIRKVANYSFVSITQRNDLFNFFSHTAIVFFNEFKKYYEPLIPNTNQSILKTNLQLDNFIRYMRCQKLSENTINKYAYQAANNPELVQIIYSSTGKTSMYDITEYLTLIPILDFVRRCNFDQIGHHMYSAAISKYIQFLKTPKDQEETTIKLTRELIEEARTPNGGFTKSQLAAVGVDWPPAPDWIEQKEGMMITKSQLEQFNKIQYIATNKVSKKKR